MILGVIQQVLVEHLPCEDAELGLKIQERAGRMRLALTELKILMGALE